MSKSNRTKGEAARQAKAQQAMRAGRSKRRNRWWTLGAAAVIVVVGAAVIITIEVRGSGTTDAADVAGEIIPSTPTGTLTVQQTPKQVTNTTGVSGVLAWDTQGWPGDGSTVAGAVQHDHVTGPVQYSVTPPIGGPHNADWMNAGVYTKPIPSERAVHNLEHGAIWITYDPDLPASEVSELVAFVGKQSLITESEQAVGIANDANRYMDLSPWASNTLPSPIVLSSWGYQLRVTSPTDPRMQQFVNTFRSNEKYTPEYGSAVDGIAVETGGRPAEYGGTQPNPAGTEPDS